MERLDFSKRVTFLVGENGTGKSTLIEALAVNIGFNPEGGTLNFNFSTEDSHSELYKYLRVTKGIAPRKDGFFLRAESFYNVASNIDQMDRMPAPGPSVIESYGGVSLHKQSHGESFMALIANRFGGNGLYILDEPEAALSPSKLLELMCHIHELEKKNSQFIISTHSPILMAYPGADVLYLTDAGIRSVSYKETLDLAPYGSYFLPEIPVGFRSESIRHYQDPYTAYLSGLWIKGYDELSWKVSKLAEEDEHRLTHAEDTERYDLSLYPIPRGDSVPEDLREVVDNPIFYAEELSPQLIWARAYKSGEQGDSNGWRMTFSVLYGNTLVKVRSKGVDPNWIYEQLALCFS